MNKKDSVELGVGEISWDFGGLRGIKWVSWNMEIFLQIRVQHLRGCFHGYGGCDGFCHRDGDSDPNP